MNERPRPKPRPLGYSLPQNEARLICPYCGHHRFDWGHWSEGGYLENANAPVQPVRARKCQGCGHIALFAQEQVVKPGPDAE